MQPHAQGEAVVAEARRWLGTPYHHQAAERGMGCDCLGLVRGIWRALYGRDVAVPPDYTADWGEFGGQEALMHALDQRLWRCAPADMAPGDIALFRIYEVAPAKHLGVISALGGRASFIHAYSGHGVVENALSRPWLRRIAAVYRFPERA